MEKQLNESLKVEKRSFSYRCFKKRFQEPVATESLVKQYHLEKGDKGEIVIVEDRPVDYVELAGKDVNNVGLANILELARKGAIDLGSCRYDSKVEAIDTSCIDPMNPQGVKDVISSADKNQKKLSDIASQLGITVDELIGSFLDGSFSSLVAKKLDDTKSEGGPDNA